MHFAAQWKWSAQYGVHSGGAHCAAQCTVEVEEQHRGAKSLVCTSPSTATFTEGFFFLFCCTREFAEINIVDIDIFQHDTFIHLWVNF